MTTVWTPSLPLPPLQEHQLHPVEAHYGLLQLAEALTFLHSDAKMMHGNLTPECVVMNKKGHWKLMGLNFASFVQYQTSSQVREERGREGGKEGDSRGSMQLVCLRHYQSYGKS